MQPQYLDRLCEPVRTFVEEVEAAAGLVIDVVEDAKLNLGGATGDGKLKVNIEAHRVQLLVPSNGYFPPGGVRHEVLHVHRLHVLGVPRLALAETVEWDPNFEQGLVHVDNALEHLSIVPRELQLHPERHAHWNAVMARVWQVDLPNAPTDLDRRIGAFLHWTFLRHALPVSPAMEVAVALLQTLGLQAAADAFADQLLPVLDDKAAVVRTFFDTFADLARHRAALEYLNSIYGTRQEPIPA